MEDCQSGLLYSFAKAVVVRPVGSNPTSSAVRKMEVWQKGYCTSLENWRGNTLTGSSPVASANAGVMELVYILVLETRFWGFDSPLQHKIE